MGRERQRQSCRTLHHPNFHSAAPVAGAELLPAAVRRILARQVFALLRAAVCGLSPMSACMNTRVMNDFEQKVLSDLAELKAHMRWVVGNGNEGKMQEIEARVDRHEAYLQRFTGIAAAVGTLLTLFHVA